MNGNLTPQGREATKRGILALCARMTTSATKIAVTLIMVAAALSPRVVWSADTWEPGCVYPIAPNVWCGLDPTEHGNQLLITDIQRFSTGRSSAETPIFLVHGFEELVCPWNYFVSSEENHRKLSLHILKQFNGILKQQDQCRPGLTGFGIICNGGAGGPNSVLAQITANTNATLFGCSETLKINGRPGQQCLWFESGAFKFDKWDGQGVPPWERRGIDAFGMYGRDGKCKGLLESLKDLDEMIPEGQIMLNGMSPSNPSQERTFIKGPTRNSWTLLDAKGGAMDCSSGVTIGVNRKNPPCSPTVIETTARVRSRVTCPPPSRGAVGMKAVRRALPAVEKGAMRCAGAGVGLMGAAANGWGHAIVAPYVLGTAAAQRNAALNGLATDPDGIPDVTNQGLKPNMAKFLGHYEKACADTAGVR